VLNEELNVHSPHPAEGLKKTYKVPFNSFFQKVPCQVFWYLRLDRKQRGVILSIFCDFVRANIVILSSGEKCPDFDFDVGKKCA